MDSWELDGDLDQDPIAQSLKLRIATGNVSRVANGIYISAVVYDEVTLRNVTLPNLPKHEVSEDFTYQDLIPKQQKNDKYLHGGLFDDWKLDGDTSNDPIARSLNFRIKSGTIKA